MPSKRNVRMARRPRMMAVGIAILKRAHRSRLIASMRNCARCQHPLRFAVASTGEFCPAAGGRGRHRAALRVSGRSKSRSRPEGNDRVRRGSSNARVPPFHRHADGRSTALAATVRAFRHKRLRAALSNPGRDGHIGRHPRLAWSGRSTAIVPPSQRTFKRISQLLATTSRPLGQSVSKSKTHPNGDDTPVSRNTRFV